MIGEGKGGGEREREIKRLVRYMYHLYMTVSSVHKYGGLLALYISMEGC